MTFRGWPDAALEFYVGLEADNSKAFWQANRAVYDEGVKAPFLELSTLIEREFGPLRVFRPNRDTRFSKDKTPYKTAAAAVTESEGGASYYVQISAEGLWTGSGYYHLQSDQLARFRDAVADHRTGPKLAAAVAAVRAEKYEVGARESLKARTTRIRPRSSARGTATHEGPARRPRLRRAAVAAHCRCGRPYRRGLA